MRIQLQKCLITANKLPRGESFQEIKQQSEGHFSTKLNQVQGSLKKVLDEFLALQTLLLKQYPETKDLFSAGSQEESNTADDEEIQSDTDEENYAPQINEKEDDPTKNRKKRKLTDYEPEMNNFHSRYKQYRNSVIQKWNDKTRILLKQNKESNSVLNQIQYTLKDKSRLIKRTQMKRSAYDVVGDDKSGSSANEDYDAEVFDDDDFYHQMLRELIEFRSADLTDPVHLGRQWVQLQTLRKKMKRNIDTRATKGRKIRYAVHSKLVNFMAPLDESNYSDEAKTDLFGSLFRGNPSSVKTGSNC